MSEDNFITIKEKERFELELKDLKENKRAEVIEQLRVARSYGDLSENAEYESARKRQSTIESRVNEIENKLKISRVVKEDHRVDVVTIGNTVEVKLGNETKSKKYDIGVSGSNIEISPHSPIANSLLGRMVGDAVKVELPTGTVEMNILKIT